MVLAADERIISRERNVIGLRLLLDSRALQEQLSFFEPLGRLERLEIDYLRYKPGENCVARISAEHDGLQVWGYAKAYGRNAGAKLGKAAERPDCGSDVGPGRLQLPRHGLEVNFLPHDNALPSVERLADRATREALLQRVFKRISYRPGGEYTVLNYKPERRLTLRYSHVDGRRSVIKFCTPGRFRQSRTFYKKLKPVEGILLPVLEGGSKAHCALAFDWRDGVTPAAQLRSGDSGDCARLGDALARFRGSRQPGLSPMDLAGEGRRVIALAEDLDGLLPDQATAAIQLAGAMRGWLEGLSGTDAAPLHGDFYAEQAVVGGSEVALIDCDRACVGHPCFDLGSFLARLEFDVLSGALAGRVAEAARADFLEGYTARAGSAVDGDLGRFVAYGLFQLLHHPFRQRLSGWPEVTRSVVERCRELWKKG